MTDAITALKLSITAAQQLARAQKYGILAKAARETAAAADQEATAALEKAKNAANDLADISLTGSQQSCQARDLLDSIESVIRMSGIENNVNTIPAQEAMDKLNRIL